MAMNDLIAPTAQNLGTWGMALFDKTNAEELFALKLADVDGKTYTVAFKIADNTVIEYTVKLTGEKALEDEAKANLHVKVESAVNALGRDDLAAVTVENQTIKTEFLSGDTTISQVTGTGIFSILTTLKNEGVKSYTFDDIAGTVIETPDYNNLLGVLKNYLDEQDTTTVLSKTVSDLTSKTVKVTVAYKDANGTEVNVEYTFTFAISDNAE